MVLVVQASFKPARLVPRHTLRGESTIPSSTLQLAGGTLTPDVSGGTALSLNSLCLPFPFLPYKMMGGTRWSPCSFQHTQHSMIVLGLNVKVLFFPRKLDKCIMIFR